MKLIFFSFFLFTLSYQVGAKVIDLPLGGQVNLPDEKWIVAPNPLLEGKSLVLLHKEEKELRGYILNGSIQTSAQCQKISKKSSIWTSCSQLISKDNNDYQQITLERKVSENTFQTYLISFAYPKEKKQKFSKLIETLTVDLEKL